MFISALQVVSTLKKLLTDEELDDGLFESEVSPTKILSLAIQFALEVIHIYPLLQYTLFPFEKEFITISLA